MLKVQIKTLNDKTLNIAIDGPGHTVANVLGKCGALTGQLIDNETLGQPVTVPASAVVSATIMDADWQPVMTA